MKNLQLEINKLKNKTKYYFFEGVIIFILFFLMLYTANISQQLKDFLMLISTLFFLSISFLALYGFNILVKVEKR